MASEQNACLACQGSRQVPGGDPCDLCQAPFVPSHKYVARVCAVCNGTGILTEERQIAQPRTGEPITNPPGPCLTCRGAGHTYHVELIVQDVRPAVQAELHAQRDTERGRERRKQAIQAARAALDKSS